MIQKSETESRRFALRIGRWQPEHADEVMDPSGYDVVIVRRPAGWSDRWFDLTKYTGYRAIHADSLVYWEWRAATPLPASAVELASQRPNDPRLPGLVREIFLGYLNHYAANPLFADAQVIAGYEEWATRTALRSGGYQTLLGEDGSVQGLAVVDWSLGIPDTRLAGMRPAARGKGRYRHLILGLMAYAARRGHRHLRISTQVHNVAVQRVWAGLGWKPVEAFDTAHLVRESLLTEFKESSRGQPD